MPNEQSVARTHQQTEFYVGETRVDPIPEPTAAPDKYNVYPEDDRSDRKRNPYSDV